MNIYLMPLKVTKIFLLNLYIMDVRSFYILALLILAKIKFKVVAYFNQVTNNEYVVNNPSVTILGHRKPKKSRL